MRALQNAYPEDINKQKWGNGMVDNFGAVGMGNLANSLVNYLAAPFGSQCFMGNKLKEVK
jgi:hypothetical protein